MKFSAWDRVRIAREMDRPTSLYYIEHIFEDFIELHSYFFSSSGVVILM